MAEKLAPLDSGINIGAEPNTDNFPNMYNSSSDSSGSLDETQEGYDYEVVPSVDKKYECPVCLMLLRNPVQTPCGHRFCKACLKRWIKESEDARCPYDNELLEEGQIFPDNFAKREIMDMKVLCQNAKHGCRLVCELRQMELHVDVCEHRLVPCPQQCEQKVPHSQLHAHLGHECVKRLVPCQHCNASVAFDEMNHHYQHCPLVTIPCEYCAQDFIRHQMEHHLSHQCEKVSVKCSFLPLGCPVEKTNMSRHSEWQLDCKVYIGDLSHGTAKHELEDAFSKYGPLRNVWVARNPPGFAFVEFEDPRDAEDACRAMDGQRINGRRVRVEMSHGKSRRSRRPPPPMRYGGGGYGGMGGARSRRRSRAECSVRGL